jgi:hypothetical protein
MTPNEQFKARLLATYGAAELTIILDGASVIETSVNGKPLGGCKAEVVFSSRVMEIVLDEINGPASITLAEVRVEPGVELTLRVDLGALEACK